MRDTCELCNGGKGLLVWNLNPTDLWTICTICLNKKNQHRYPVREHEVDLGEEEDKPMFTWNEMSR